MSESRFHGKQQEVHLDGCQCNRCKQFVRELEAVGAPLPSELMRLHNLRIENVLRAVCPTFIRKPAPKPELPVDLL